MNMNTTQLQDLGVRLTKEQWGLLDSGHTVMTDVRRANGRVVLQRVGYGRYEVKPAY